MSIFSLWGWCLSGGGKIKIQIPIYLCNVIVNFSLGILFIKTTGLVGPILGTLSGFLLVYSWLIPKALEKELAVPRNPLYKNLFYPIILLAPTYLLAFHCQDFFRPKNFFELAFDYTVLFLSTSAFLSMVYLDTKERSFVITQILKRINIKQSRS
jgi:hypothetical protein